MSTKTPTWGLFEITDNFRCLGVGHSRDEVRSLPEFQNLNLSPTTVSLRMMRVMDRGLAADGFKGSFEQAFRAFLRGETYDNPDRGWVCGMPLPSPEHPFVPTKARVIAEPTTRVFCLQCQGGFTFGANETCPDPATFLCPSCQRYFGQEFGPISREVELAARRRR